MQSVQFQTICSVLPKKDLLIEMLDSLSDSISTNLAPDIVLEKIASMSCKAAVKGNSRLSGREVDALIGELLELDNPYHCPHGRPTIIAMTKRELEKKILKESYSILFCKNIIV